VLRPVADRQPEAAPKVGFYLRLPSFFLVEYLFQVLFFLGDGNV